ncbi:MAG TPA: tRNA lysidine(34) synthetase TilS [Hyphomicrobiaceae bacterium]|nr:tRNA lysidine(34) synthetase TilS [Hyphomicrobiaceae bacterium]
MTRPASAARGIAEEEIDDLFAPLLPYESLVLAVSGGADSMALMHLFCRWRARRPATRIEALVATVDHGLRPDSTREAAWVARQARRVGLRHETLKWAGEKPTRGIQEAAREARYRMLAETCLLFARGRPSAVVTAHQQDDQAETFVMRLARGSGLDGLSGMPPVRSLAGRGLGPALVRPLLSIPKARLEATLVEQGLEWIEDPSNEIDAFERVRMRKALAELEKLGITRRQIAESAHRLQRAREAVESALSQFEVAVELDIVRSALARFDRAVFLAGPTELRLRLLARLIEAFGGQAEPPRLAKIESLAARMEHPSWHGSTLGGCVIVCDKGQITVSRECGRAGLPEIVLAPGGRAVWDRRFVVSLSPRQRERVVVRALGTRELRRLARLSAGTFELPARAAATLPAFWRADKVIAVPQLGWPPECAKAPAEEPPCGSEFIW